MTDTLQNLLADASFSTHAKELCKQILPYMKKLNIKSYNVARKKLNILQHSVTNSEHYEVVNAALFLFKKLHECEVPTPSYRDEHVITDHAFCTALRRYCKTDLLAEKDAVLRLANANAWPYAQRNGKITTFYPPEAA